MYIKSIYFDIGSTLVKGASFSPNKEISKILDVDSDVIGQLIMKKEFNNPEEAIKSLYKLKKDFNSFHEENIRRIWYVQEQEAKEAEGATEVIRFFKNKGYKIGLISDIWVPYYRSFERACPKISAIVDSTTLSFKEGLKKPNENLFKKALSSLDTSPEQALIVGDTYHNDIYPAIKLHMHTIWLLSRPEREVEALANVINGRLPKPDYVIKHINELKDIEYF